MLNVQALEPPPELQDYHDAYTMQFSEQIEWTSDKTGAVIGPNSKTQAAADREMEIVAAMPESLRQILVAEGCLSEDTVQLSNRTLAAKTRMAERDPDQSLTVEDYAVQCADIVTTIPLMGGIDALTEHAIKGMSRLKAPPELEGYHNTALKFYQELQKEGSLDRVSRSTLMEAEREIDALSPSLINYLITTGCITG